MTLTIELSFYIDKSIFELYKHMLKYIGDDIKLMELVKQEYTKYVNTVI